MSRLRVGILGCGSFARRHAGVVLQLPQELELAAFCDRNDWKARAFADELTGGQAAAYTSHREMLEGAALDILIICLPPTAHTDEVELAAGHGVHLLIEKPIALDSAQGWQMVRAAETAGIKTQVGFMYRFGAAVEAFKAAQDAGQTGPVGMFDAQFFCNALHAPWWRDKTRSGGQLLEQLIHHLDLMRYLAGDPVRVFARQANLFHQQVPGYTIEDFSVTVAQFEGGGLGILRGSNAAVPGRWNKAFSVIAREASLHAADHNRGTLHWTGVQGEPPEPRQERPPEIIDAPDEAHLRQLRDLINAICTGGLTRTPLREGARTLDLALAAVRAAETGQEVKL